LVGRGTETAEEQQRRLETAKLELAAEAEFDVTIVNDDVRRAADELVAVMGLAPHPA
jgi:guanylate kinase